jgi:hypothetical protein
MTHAEKVAYFLRDVAVRSASPYLVAPVSFRLLWRLGVPIPPPPFLGFRTNLLLWGTCAAVLVGLSAMVRLGHTPSLPLACGIMALSLLAGLAAGLMLAGIHSGMAVRHGWLDWGQYPPQPGDAAEDDRDDAKGTGP